MLLIAAGIAAVVLPGCGHRAASRSEQTPQFSQANPSDFPLYHGSVVDAVVPVDSAQVDAAMRASDSKAGFRHGFRGHEIIAETGATFPQLKAWVKQLKAAPPAGLHVALDSFSFQGDSSSETFLTGTQFDSRHADRSVIVVVADPRGMHEFTSTLSMLIDNYDKVPQMLRAPIDAQAKEQLGYTVTEMLDPKSPVGAVVATLKRLGPANRRGILLIDEKRQQ